jgi:putative transposase
MFRALLILVASALSSAAALFRSRENQAIVELALRQQLAVYVHGHPRPRLSPLDRAFWVTLSRVWPQWRSALVLVRPETVIRWHRKAFRGYWRWISKPGPGRPTIPEETKALIIRMATENGWRARKIQAELSKLGIHLGLTTISRNLPKAGPGKDPHQRWMTFLRNHRDLTAGNGSLRRPDCPLHAALCLVRPRPRQTACPSRQRDFAPYGRLGDSAAAGRFPESSNTSISDLRHAIFSPEVAHSVSRFGIHPRRTALQSPWQNGTAERFVGSVRRELLDHVVVLGEDHLRRLLREYVGYYNAERVHTSIGDSPEGRAVQERPSDQAQVVGLPRVGGLHHRYAWREAA